MSGLPTERPCGGAEAVEPRRGRAAWRARRRIRGNATSAPRCRSRGGSCRCRRRPEGWRARQVDAVVETAALTRTIRTRRQRGLYAEADPGLAGCLRAGQRRERAHQRWARRQEERRASRLERTGRKQKALAGRPLLVLRKTAAGWGGTGESMISTPDRPDRHCAVD